MTSPGDAKGLPSASSPGSSSGAIPLPRSHIPRTRSELQLEDDRKEYEWREGVVYNRIVSGMIMRSDRHPEISRSAWNIIRAQAGPVRTREDAEVAASPAPARERARLGSAVSADSSGSDSSGGSSSSSSSEGDDEWLLYDEGGACPALEFQRARSLPLLPFPHDEEDDDAIFELDL